MLNYRYLDPSGKLTGQEHAALETRFNLADAHTHQLPTDEEVRRIWSRLPAIAEGARRLSQAEVDETALHDFLTLSQQTTALDWCPWLPCYSASVALEILASALRRNHRIVYMVEPTFDSLADTLRRHGITLQPISMPVEDGDDEALERRLLEAPGAVFLVTPNNPTGGVVPARVLESIAKLCASRRVPIILDSSFRLFDPAALFDIYQILKRVGCSFAVIEDTGKVWPTLDLKLAFLLCSPDIYAAALPVYEDILLNVSPFISALVSEYARFSRDDSLSSVRALIFTNREMFRLRLSQTREDVSVAYPTSQVSVQLVRLPSGFSSTAVAATLRDEFGVAVLPGSGFYWSDESGRRGDDLVRIALARSTSYFEQAIDRFIVGLNHVLVR